MGSFTGVVLLGLYAEQGSCASGLFVFSRLSEQLFSPTWDLPQPGTPSSLLLTYEDSTLYTNNTPKCNF